MTVIEVDSPQGSGEIKRIVPDTESAVDVSHLPGDVELYYLGAKKVLTPGFPDAAAVQLRKTLEAAAVFPGGRARRTKSTGVGVGAATSRSTSASRSRVSVPCFEVLRPYSARSAHV